MKTATAICAALVAAILLTGCAPKFKDITIVSESNPKVDLVGYRTYAWGLGAAVIRDPEDEWTPSDLDVDAELRFLVDRELRKRGLSEVVENPDMLVIYAIGVDMKFLDVTVDEADVERFEEVPMGGVLIVLADPETRQAIWAGAAEAEIAEEPNLELAKERMDYAVTEMFKRYPR